jgi:AcrR family transcriptional regulator
MTSGRHGRVAPNPPNDGPAGAIARAAARSRSAVAGPRDRILAEAVVLFYREGIRAVGVDLIIGRSGTAKATFYRHFPSKADLVLAYLERRSDAFLGWLAAEVTARADGRAVPLLLVFEVLGDLFADDAYRGCAVTNAVVEVGGEMPRVMDRARRHNDALRTLLGGLAPEAAAATAPGLADACLLLVDGALVAAQRERGRDPADRARAAAADLLGRPRARRS